MPTKQEILEAGEEALANISAESAEARRKATAGMDEAERRAYDIRPGSDYDRWGKKCGCSAEEFRNATMAMVKTDDDVKALMMKVIQAGSKFRTDDENKRIAEWMANMSGKK